MDSGSRKSRQSGAFWLEKIEAHAIETEADSCILHTVEAQRCILGGENRGTVVDSERRKTKHCCGSERRKTSTVVDLGAEHTMLWIMGGEM